ncbi:unnamed protein product [Plutella xylostella]|uniref:(diamondback moth) hypothetical protein n=1 Tax=Plutella xylostella TaxID=51655 RepID=A0A8S4GE00_PLUXY|nr:unnamed protein product [Plutella xylostella]
MKVAPIVEKMKSHRLSWFGHVMRRGDDYVTKKVLEMRPEGRRKRGRPRKTWLDCVKENMRECGVNEDMTEDRRFRRKLDDADHYRPRGGVLADDEAQADPPECTDEYCKPPTHPPRAPAARRQGNGCPFDYCPPTVHPRSKIYIKLNAQADINVGGGLP